MSLSRKRGANGAATAAADVKRKSLERRKFFSTAFGGEDGSFSAGGSGGGGSNVRNGALGEGEEGVTGDSDVRHPSNQFQYQNQNQHQHQHPYQPRLRGVMAAVPAAAPTGDMGPPPLPRHGKNADAVVTSLLLDLAAAIMAITTKLFHQPP